MDTGASRRGQQPCPRDGVSRTPRTNHNTMTNTTLTTKLWNTLNTNPTYKHQLKHILQTKLCDISPEFLGFINAYYHLSQIIPKNRTIYDLGCAYAPQAIYFTNHTAYIGIDILTKTHNRITTPNSKHYKMTIKQYLTKHPIIDNHFAILNYIPPWYNNNEQLTKQHFKHLYIYYP